MKEQETSFSKKFDNLFEKPIVKTFDSKKTKILTLTAVIVVGLFAAAPFIFFTTALFSSQTLMNHEYKKLDRLEDAQPYVTHKILKENLKLTTEPNYQSSKNYKIKFSSSSNIISFGNGYQLDVENSKSLSNVGTNKQIKIKAKEYSSIDNLATYNFSDIDYAEMIEPLSIMISGNLIDNYELQLSKLDGAWARVLPVENLRGGTKNGYVINYEPHSSRSERGVHSYVTITRYWVFPDGVGIVIYDDALCEGSLKKNQIKNISNEELLGKINLLTQGRIERLDKDFVMKEAF